MAVSICVYLTTIHAHCGEGLMEDGLMEDGLVEDGLVEDGLVEDGLVEDGLVEDGLVEYFSFVLFRSSFDDEKCPFSN